MWQFVLSQVFAGLALIAMLVAFQCKSPNRTLFIIAIFNTLIALSNALLYNWVVVGIFALAVLRDLVFLWQRKYYPNDRGIELTTLGVFLVLSIVVFYFTHSGWWYSWLLQAAALFVILGSWWRGIHLIRISRVVISVVAIYNHVYFLNYTNIAVEVVSLITIVIFYIRWQRCGRTWPCRPKCVRCVPIDDTINA